MFRRLPVIGVGLLMALDLCAATPQEDFSAFRRSIHQDFTRFRSDISRRYADFLAGAWAEFKGMKGERAPEIPKPRLQPALPSIHEGSQDIPLPDTPVPQPDPPVSSPVPSMPDSASPGYDSFVMLGVPMRIPRISVAVLPDLSTQADFVAQWGAMAASPDAPKAVEAVRRLADDYGLNDYLTFLALLNWAHAVYPSVSPASRLSLVHYLLVESGIDARIALSGGTPLILLPAEVRIYGRSYCDIDGRRYYFFADDPEGKPVDTRLTFNTCALPEDARGRICDFLIHGLRPPMKAKNVAASCGGMRLRGTLNANIMPWVYRYPHMEMAAYEMSVLDEDFRKEIMAQAVLQLAPLDETAGVNLLLSFVQNAFGYSTDGEAHGFEKPYFAEETFFFPVSDCEDRAILFVWLAEKALRHRCQLIGFPGHEAAGILLKTPVDGDSYIHEGKRYHIADPTFQGAGVGVCMPSYQGVAPTVDYTTP